MPPEERDTSALWDMVRAAGNIEAFLADMDAEAFHDDKKTHFAVIYQIQVIGEATKRLSEAFREAHAEIPWRKIAGMRDFVVHGYDQVNLRRVWDTATISVPELIAQIKRLLPPEPLEE